MNTRHRQLDPVWRQRTTRLLLAASCCLIFASLAQAQDQTFIVPGTSGNHWFDTQLDIAPGTLLRLAAVGEVEVGGGRVYGPRGTTTFTDAPGFPAETRSRYGLVARLTARADINPGRSEDGLFEQFVYGDLPGNRYCAASGGRLWLTVNDNSPSDNSGAFTVILTRGTCRSEAGQARLSVNLYASDARFSRPRTQFRSGDTIVLRIENNTGNSIYLRQALDPSRLIRGEGLQIERAVGSGFVPVLPFGRRSDATTTTDNGAGTRITMDYALTALLELRTTMSITRSWSVLSPNGPGTYRLSLVYYNSRDTQTSPRTIYSPTFEVQ